MSEPMYKVGDLVEVKYENWLQDGSCELVHARLWVVEIEQDRDEFVYVLGSHRKESIQSMVRDTFMPGFLHDVDLIKSKWLLLGGLMGLVRGRFFDTSILHSIHWTKNTGAGIGALSWDEYKEDDNETDNG